MSLLVLHCASVCVCVSISVCGRERERGRGFYFILLQAAVLPRCEGCVDAELSSAQPGLSLPFSRPLNIRI